MCTERYPQRIASRTRIRRRREAFLSCARSSLLAYALLAVLAFTFSASGQQRRTEPIPRMPLARYAPASANLFITIHRLDEVDAAMHRTRAWRLLPMLAENPAGNDTAFDLRGTLQSFLGPTSPIRIDDLMGTEIGLVAPSWSELTSAVWLVHVPDESVIDRWFPQDRSAGGKGSRPNRPFRAGEVLVSVRNDVAAMVRPKASAPLVRDTLMLLAGRPEPALGQTPEFQDLMGQLPPAPLAVAYFNGRRENRQGEATPGAGIPSSFLPTINCGVVGLYEGDGRIDFALRASLDTVPDGPVLSDDAIERLVRLPQTTLFGMAIAIDFDRAHEAAVGNPSSAILGRVLTLLAGLRDPSEADAGPLPRLGPRVILAWDQDLRGESSSPQVAVLIECRGAKRMREAVRGIAGNALRLIRTIDQVDADSVPAILQTAHLGTPILYIPLTSYAEQSRFPAARLFASTEPAWAAVGNWFVFALSRDHVERILDAQHSLIPRLATLNDVMPLKWRRVDRTALSVAQADLAAVVLDEWLRDFEGGGLSLLDPKWWAAAGRPASSGVPRRLGIGMKADQKPGVVVVARVYPGTAAAGRLSPGDRIIGINGHLLSLESPNADLRRGWAGAKDDATTTFRVQRDEDIIEVTLDRSGPVARSLMPRIAPADAVRELASLGRTLQFASFTSFAAQSSSYSARLSLRFAPPAPTVQAQGE